MISRISALLCLAVLVACASAFAPADRTTTYAPMKRVSGYAAPREFLFLRNHYHYTHYLLWGCLILTNTCSLYANDVFIP